MNSEEAENLDPAPAGDIVCGLVAYRDALRVFELTRPDHPYYWIDLDRILAARQFADWIWVLYTHARLPSGKKIWLTGEQFLDFLTCLWKVIGRQWGQSPFQFYEVCGTANEDLDGRTTITPQLLGWETLPEDQKQAVIRALRGRMKFHVNEKGEVVLDLGGPCRALTMLPAIARDVAEHLLAAADQAARGEPGPVDFPE